MKFLKFILICLVILFASFGIYSFVQLFDDGKWFEHASYITAGLVIVATIAIPFVAYFIIKFIMKLPNNFKDFNQ